MYIEMFRSISVLFGAVLMAVCVPSTALGQFWTLNSLNNIYNNNVGGKVGIGTANPAHPLHVETTASRAVFARSSAAAGPAYGIYAQSTSTNGFGVLGLASALSGPTRGIQGQSASTGGTGVFGVATSPTGITFGIQGISKADSGTGVKGVATAGTSPGSNFGVWGEAAGENGTGLYGLATHTGGGATYGVYGRATTSASGHGVVGFGNEVGVRGESGKSYGWGVQAVASATSGDTTALGAVVLSPEGTAVSARATSQTGETYGVWAWNHSPDGFAILAGKNEPMGTTLHVQGNFKATGLKDFQIDHPLDPANKYLSHHSAEGPEPLLIYRGNVTLDPHGQAIVQLPDYFESINRDVQYQLTPIGAFAPVYVAEEVTGNAFRIAGGWAGMKVSWTVTGVRNDAYVRAYGAPVEEGKPERHRGRYLHPELFGESEELAIHHAPRAEIVHGSTTRR